MGRAFAKSRFLSSASKLSQHADIKGVQQLYRFPGKKRTTCCTSTQFRPNWVSCNFQVPHVSRDQARFFLPAISPDSHEIYMQKITRRFTFSNLRKLTYGSITHRPAIRQLGKTSHSDSCMRAPRAMSRFEIHGGRYNLEKTQIYFLTFREPLHHLATLLSNISLFKGALANMQTHALYNANVNSGQGKNQPRIYTLHTHWFAYFKKYADHFSNLACCSPAHSFARRSDMLQNRMVITNRQSAIMIYTHLIR